VIVIRSLPAGPGFLHNQEMGADSGEAKLPIKSINLPVFLEHFDHTTPGKRSGHQIRIMCPCLGFHL